MSPPPSRERPRIRDLGPVETQTLFVLQVACGASAIAALPQDGPGAIAPAWLATFILPSILFLWLGNGWRARICPGWLRPLLGAASLGLLAYFSYETAGPLDKKSTLACSLLPAMSLFTLRREPNDTGLSLFLSFCFLLIGIMLNREQADWTMLVFLGCCTWALQIEAKNRGLLRRHAVRGRSPRLSTRIVQRAQMTSLLLTLAFLIHGALDLLPSPGDNDDPRRSSNASASNNHSVGITDDFDLSGRAGSPLGIESDRIIQVFDPNRNPVPSDLYLRYTFVDRAGTTKWARAPVQTVTHKVADIPRWPAFHRVLPSHQLLVQRLEPPRKGEVFVPPGVRRISGMRRLRYDHDSGYYQTPDLDNEGYQVTYHRPHLQPRIRAFIDPMLVESQHTRIPKVLDEPRFAALTESCLDGLDPRTSPPMQIARRLARSLEQRYQYDLRIPEGKETLEIQRFLYESHQGFCMHFATALAMMLRKLQIPCRIAMGLQGGDPAPGGGNSRLFGSQHAHAWVELPLNEHGWTIIDPTPAAHRADRGWPEPEQQPRPGPGDGQKPDPAQESCLIASLFPFLGDPADWLRNPLDHLGVWLTITGIGLLACMGFFMLRRRAAQQDDQERRGVQPPRPDQHRAHHLMEQLLKAMRRAGQPRPPRMTMEQYLEMLDTQNLDDDLDLLRAAVLAYQEVRFGSHRLDEAREEALQRALLWARGRPRREQRSAG